MDGIKFVTDENDKKVAVQIDLEKYGELVQDLIDAIIAESQKKGKKIPLQEVKRMLQARRANCLSKRHKVRRLDTHGLRGQSKTIFI